MCKYEVFMFDDDDVFERRIDDPSLIDISVDSSVFLCVRCFLKGDRSFMYSANNQLNTINAMYQFCGPEQSIC